MSLNHVVFGTGAIGRAVMNELVKRGESVRMVNHSGKMDDVPCGVEVVASDLYDPAKVKEVTRGTQVVYQSAQPHYHEWPKKFPALQKSIIDGLTGSGAKLVLVENLYMYGATNGIPMTENTPHNAQTRKGKVRSEISNAAFAAHCEGKLRVTAARGSDYFGPWGLTQGWGGGIFLYRILAGKSAQIFGSAKAPHTYTYIPDFGKALVILGEQPEADGAVWHVPNDMSGITQGDFVKMIADEAGVAVKIQPGGKTIAALLGLFSPASPEIIEMMYEFEQPFLVDSSKFEKTFGMKATPMKNAVKETVAWFKSHPQKK
jgi:nucleoside-diphosphate-sugar epimerase